MCGISGLFSFSGDYSSLEKSIKKMSSSISHRGPDHSGIWIDSHVLFAIAHQRLSVLDLSPAGNQPMVVMKVAI